MAKTAFEDTYITMSDVDGIEWVDNLRVRVSFCHLTLRGADKLAYFSPFFRLADAKPPQNGQRRH